ncbi:MAG: glycosyltransferase family 4 protein [Pirellulales bacterium]|nr:glycosyltransferase family 4 protein [Pirellulales bacterium]
MSGYRIVFVARRFWPEWDGASRTLGALAAALVERGWRATVLTVQQYPRWSAMLRWRGVAVVRFPLDPTSRRGEAGYVRSLGRWFREHRGEYDLVYVAGLRHDAHAVLGAVGRGVPVVLRAETTGRWGDCLWQIDARDGRRIKQRTMRAAALIGPSEQARHELIAAGYPRDRVHFIPYGVPTQPPRDAAGRTTARRWLAADRPELALTDAAPLAVFVSRLDHGRGLDVLLAAWRGVAARRPHARLWLVGHGPWQATLQQRIDAAGLDGRVTLAGRFDEVDTLLSAADVFVSPSPEADLSVALIEAMAAGLPVVACDRACNREAVDNERQGLLVPPGDADALASALGRLIDQPELARRLGAAAQVRANERFALAKMVDAQVTLFEQWLAPRETEPRPLGSSQPSGVRTCFETNG